MTSATRKTPHRFVACALLAMAVVTPFGLTAQRWMTYELLGVDGGFGDWCLAAVMLAVIAVGTAVLMGVPCLWVTRVLGLEGTARGVAFCVLASVATAVAHRAVVPFGTTVIDHAVPPALGLIFFGALYASYGRDDAAEESTAHDVWNEAGKTA